MRCGAVPNIYRPSLKASLVFNDNLWIRRSLPKLKIISSTNPTSTRGRDQASQACPRRGSTITSTLTTGTTSPRSYPLITRKWCVCNRVRTLNAQSLGCSVSDSFLFCLPLNAGLSRGCIGFLVVLLMRVCWCRYYSGNCLVPVGDWAVSLGQVRYL